MPQLDIVLILNIFVLVSALSSVFYIFHLKYPLNLTFTTIKLKFKLSLFVSFIVKQALDVFTKIGVWLR